MSYFTVIQNDQLGQIIKCNTDKIDALVPANSSYIAGAFSRDQYKWENGEVVQLSNAEKAALPRTKNRTVKHKVSELAQHICIAGTATTAALPANPNDWTKQDAINAINQAAGRARTRAISQGNLLVMEYERLITQVRLWISDGRNQNAVPAMLASYALHSGLPVSGAADHIVAASDNYDALLAVTYDKRHAGASDINAASSNFASIAQPFIDYLDAL